MYIRKVKYEEKVCFKEEFQNIKASITLKQLCQPTKKFT